MATVRQELEGAAFWDGMTCLRCGASTHEEAEEYEAGDTCERCDSELLVPAKRLLRFVQRLEDDAE